MMLVSQLNKNLLRVAWPVCFGLGFVSSYSLSGRYAPSISLDSSWSAVLEYAFEHHFQFGKDLVFTYGPFGFLSTNVSQGHLVEQRLGFALLWSVVVAWAAIGVARRITAAPVRLVFLGWFLIFSRAGSTDEYAFLVMVYGCLVLLGEMGPKKGAAAVFLLVFALMALIKFPFFLVATATVVVCATGQLCRGKAQASTLIVALFGAILVVLWLVAGQNLENLWPWIRGSLEITNGYTEAMTVVPKGSVFVASTAAGALFLATLWLILRSRPLSINTRGLLAITTLCVFVTWKLSFVRADDHVFLFILALPLLSAVLFIRPVQDSLPNKTRIVLCFVYVSVVLLCSLAANLEERGTMLGKLRDWPRHMLKNARLVRKSMTADRLGAFPVLRPDQNKQQPDLPIARELIGKEPVDVVNYLQWAALVNGLVYRPRPVIQGYSAHTPYLQELNRAFFESDRRPSYLLLHMETIDGRFPTLDDATVLPYILNTYVPVARDRNFLVLKASGRTSDDVGLTLVHERTLAFGERLDLTPWNDVPVFMQATIRPTLLGRAIRFLFQAPVLFLYTHDAEGKLARHRFIPLMAEHGFLVSPLLQTNNDVIDLLIRERGSSPTAIHFSRSAGAWGQLCNVINVRLYQAKNFPSHLLDRVNLRDIAKLRNPVFDPYPSSIESRFPPEWVEVDGAPALMVHAPSTVVLQIPLGAKQFCGSIGIMENAYVQGSTGSVEFAIDVEEQDGENRRLLTRLVQPREHAADQGRIPFKVSLDSQTAKRLVLTARTGPKNDGSWNWSVWSGCRFR